MKLQTLLIIIILAVMAVILFVAYKLYQAYETGEQTAANFWAWLSGQGVSSILSQVWSYIVATISGSGPNSNLPGVSPLAAPGAATDASTGTTAGDAIFNSLLTTPSGMSPLDSIF